MAGPYYNRYSAQRENLAMFLPTRAVGLDSASIFSVKSYLGAKMVLLADNRNNTFRCRGILAEYCFPRGLNERADLIGFTSDMTIYALR